MIYIPETRDTRTVFGEDVTTNIRTIFSIKPGWGVSRLRDLATTSGTGANVGETNGEISLNSGTTAEGSAQLRTVERGQYLAGSVGVAGIGIRLPNAPVGTQTAQWGYYDQSSGLGFGFDENGNYVFLRRDGVDAKHYQDTWNVDRLLGTEGSKIQLDLTKGCIFQVNFVWYGYGTIDFYIIINNNEGVKEKVLVHQITPEGSTSILEPNQPITVDISNGGTTTTPLDFRVGGRQFSLLNANSSFMVRRVAEGLRDHTILSDVGVWEPLIGLRLKPTHGPSGRPNSVKAILSGATIVTTKNIEFQLTYDEETTSGTWDTPEGWTTGEAACETKKAPFTAVGSGLTVGRDFVLGGGGTGNNAQSGSGGYKDDLVFANTQEIVLWARRLESQTTVVNAILSWREEW